MRLLKELFDIKFEGHYFMATKHLHKWLVASYKDYMKQPPPEKRIGVAPVSAISFGRDEYLNNKNL